MSQQCDKCGHRCYCPTCDRKTLEAKRKAGRTKSPAKSQAARINGIMGGRPRKDKPTESDR